MPEDDEPFEIGVAMTRGTSTNDRDKIKASVSAETLDELDEKKEAMVERLEDLAAEVRTIQPDEDEAIDEDQATLDAAAEEES